MIGINRWKLGTLAIVFGLFIVISVSQAEQTYDITDCGSATFVTNSESKELTVMTFDIKGMTRSNHENKIFDNCSFNHWGVLRDMAGQLSAYGYSKYLDPDGDFVVMESVRVGAEVTCKFLQGTGKWKGIKGGGVVRRVAQAKPIMPGTSQLCSRHIGTFELPK